MTLKTAKLLLNMKIVELFKPDEFTSEIEHLMKLAEGWDSTTEMSKRKFYQWKYTFREHTYVPKNLEFAEKIVHRIMQMAKETVPVGHKIIPIQMLCLFYENSDDSCPMHIHGFRQITVSFGSTRKFQIDTKKVRVPSGHAIILNGHNHGVLKSKNTKLIVSFNLFYTTNKEVFGLNKKIIDLS